MRDPGPQAKDKDEFLGWIVETYLARSEIDRETAQAFAEAFFDDEPGLALVFGDPNYDWSRAGAATLVDEDMSYWDD